MQLHDTDVVVVLADGTTSNSGLTAEEVSAFEVLHETLQAEPVIRTRYPNLKLIHVEVNRGIPDQEVGRYYLRYQSDAGITEFWGHHAGKSYVDCQQGYVGVNLS